jgi:hypothetical protein
VSGRTDFLEIDKSPLDIGIDQLYPDPVADIHAIEPLNHFPFNRNINQPNPRAFLGCACDERIKLFSDP